MPDDLRLAPGLRNLSADTHDISSAPDTHRSRRGRVGARFSGLLSLGASAIPGGGAISVVANGVQALAGGGREEQLDQMWQMQQDSQFFNMEYMQLQQAAQNENRHFSSLSNLMKARHDTAKAAINNIRV